ncbi:MAG: M20/M25/M40 family metallo-hydrolase [Candidatus Eisenbacteria bacterium]
MPRRALFLALMLLPLAGPRALAFEGARAKAIVDTIASDVFQGRKSGLAGGRMVEEFVAARFRSWGLDGGGAGGGHFHEFPMLVTEEREGGLELLDGPRAPLAFLHGDDFVLATNSGSGDVTAEVVLAGHGIANEMRGRDDYGGIDIRGKIVVILRESPDDAYDWEPAISRDSTLEEALHRGAAGVLWLRGDRAVAGGAVHEGAYSPDAPLAAIGSRVFGHFLAGTGYDAKRYESELAKAPFPLAVGKRVHLRADVERVENGSARNVVGIVRGADPVLRNEILLVGAHMDHLGTTGDGLVYNGANDNASGTAVLMELARSFAAPERKPARTIVFAAFAAEEQGLLGSRAFVSDPPIDLDAVVAMMNLDVEGHGDGKVGIGGGTYFPEIWADFRGSLEPSAAESLVAGRPWGGESSDHAPFRNAGIPAMSIWSAGEHRFYHTIEDDPEWVTEEVLGSVGRMTERWIRALAEWPAPLGSPHRAGRTMLYGSDQVDFDGSLKGRSPAFIRCSLLWLEAREWAGEALLDALAGLRVRADGGDTLAVVSSIDGVRGASRGGSRCVLPGLRAEAGSLSRERIALLHDLGVGLVAWAAVPPADGETGPGSFAREGIGLLIPPGQDWRSLLPPDAKAYVRFFPGRGEGVAEPDSFPRGSVLFVASLEGRMEPERLARLIERIGWDRIHLDLVPWLALARDAAGSMMREELLISAFLEDLQRVGALDSRRMRALLGENLAR